MDEARIRADKFSQRIAGTAVFLSPRLDAVPNPLLHSIKHYKVLHERVVICTVTDSLPMRANGSVTRAYSLSTTAPLSVV